MYVKSVEQCWYVVRIQPVLDIFDIIVLLQF